MLSLQLKWTDFLKYSVRNDMVLLYSAPRTLHPLPRRWFTDNQFAELKSILQQALGQPKG